jgi:hypothetical protein
MTREFRVSSNKEFRVSGFGLLWKGHVGSPIDLLSPLLGADPTLPRDGTDPRPRGNVTTRPQQTRNLKLETPSVQPARSSPTSAG